MESGVEVLECDVQLSSDGVAVVMHDPTVDRTTNGQGAVRELQWAQIHTLTAGYPGRFGDVFAGQVVPRLDELFDLAKGRAAVFVEIKPEALADLSGSVEASVIDAALRTGMMDDVGILSFASRALQCFHETVPSFPLGLVFRWWHQRRLVEETLQAGANYLVGYAPSLLSDPTIVSRAHDEGLLVGAYVADTVENMRGLLRDGVDGIATNCVGDLLPAFHQVVTG